MIAYSPKMKNLGLLQKFHKTYPQILFKLNKNLDKWTGVNFLYHQRGGLNFGANILRYHPKLSSAKKLGDKQKQKFIFSYIDNYYQTHLRELKKAKIIFQTQWDKKEKEFFGEVGKIFNYHPWPKGKYLAFISIFPCGPRFLKDKTFQVFYLTKRGPSLSCAHEMIHFLFYDYFEKKIPEINPKEDSVWKLSEIINTFILDSAQFRLLFGVSHPHPYPAHLSLIKKLRVNWKKKKNLKTFLARSLKIIEKETQKL